MVKMGKVTQAKGLLGDYGNNPKRKKPRHAIKLHDKAL